MVLTLRDLLERIRPAGTPGAPTEGERRRRHQDRADEVAVVAEVLAEFETEAGALVAAAERDAGRIRERAKRRARAMAATWVDRAAAAGAAITADIERRGDTDEVAIRTGSEREVARLEETAARAVPVLVDRAIQLIWASATTTAAEPRS